MNRLSLREDIRPLSEFRAHVAGFIGQVRDRKRPLLITHHGKSAAVLLGVDQYEDLLDQLELLQDVDAAERELHEGRGLPHEQARLQALRRLRK